MASALVLMTGLPGTGKSTVAEAVARTLPAALLSADPIDAALLRAGVRPEQRPDILGFEVMKALAALQLEAGLHAVIDAVNPFAWVRQSYRGIAAANEAAFVVVATYCSDSELHRARVAKRLPAKIDWDGVMRQVDDYEAPEGEMLHLDAVYDEAENVRAAVDYVLSRVSG